MEIMASKRVRSIGAYAFAAVDEEVEKLRAKGVSPIDFGVGDPTTPTPALVREACQRAVDARAASGYPSYVGAPEYRRACADWMARRFDVQVDWRTEVASTIGSKEAVFHFAEAFVDPGDVVISPTPGYPPYARGTLFAEGESYFYPLTADRGFAPDLGAIPESVLRRAKVLWICYPNSPTGKLATDAFLAEAVAFCRKREIILASDEAYTEIYFTGEPPKSALQFGKEGAIAFFSMSKRSAMTGWRVGWVAGDRRIVDVFKKVKTNIDSGTPTFIQDAAIAALADEAHVAAMREEYRQKRDILCDGLVRAGLPDCRPEATLYVWQRVPQGQTSVDFARALLREDLAIVCTPGSWLGGPAPDGSNPGEGYVRFALVPSVEETRVAAERIARTRF